MTFSNTPIIPIDINFNKLRFKKISDKVLVTNDYGNWLELSKKEYDSFKFGIFSSELYKKFEDNFMILNKNNFNDAVKRVDDYYWHISNGTGLHIVVPTLRCNFTCKYCYALRAPEDSKDKDMTPELMDKTVDFIFSTPSKYLTLEFSGGEPLLRFDLVKQAVLKATKLSIESGKKIRFAMITNGSLIDEEKIEFFKKHKIGICLSIDGPKDLHDKNRKFTALGKGSYDSVISKLELLKNNDYMHTNSLPVIVKDSLAKWKEIVDEYVNLGFRSIRYKYVSKFGFASNNWSSMSYSPDEYLESWKKVIDYLLELNKKGIIIAEDIATIMVAKIKTGKNQGYAELEIPCGAVIGQLVYDYDGSIYTCDEARTMSEFKIGNVYDSKYVDLLDNSVTKSMQSVSNLFGTCDECPYVSFCGICPLEIYKEEKGFITNMPSNYRCKIHKGMFNYLFDKILNDPLSKEELYKWADIRENILKR